MKTKLEFHPFAERFPIMEGEEWETFRESIKATNGPEHPIAYRMVKGKRQGLDGRNRLRACDELGLQCPMEEIKVSDDGVKDFILCRNVHRRHMTRELRQQIVAELREDGESIREIADAIGVPKSTVADDIAQVSGTGHLEEPEKVTGKDGKTYSASNPKQQILCDRCQRAGVSRGCPMCADLRRPNDKPDPKPAPEPSVNGEELKDNFGNIIPKRCRDTWGDPWIQDTYDLLCVLSEKIRKARVGDGIRKRAKKFPFFNEKDVADGAAFVVQYLDDLLDHFKAARPAAVCPGCEGKGCAACKLSGLIPRQQYLDATKGAAR